jgi:hypothetical protein
MWQIANRALGMYSSQSYEWRNDFSSVDAISADFREKHCHDLLMCIKTAFWVQIGNIFVNFCQKYIYLQKIITSIPDRLSNTWFGEASIPRDYFPPTVNKFMGTAIHNTGKTPEEVKYEVVSPMPGIL